MLTRVTMSLTMYYCHSDGNRRHRRVKERGRECEGGRRSIACFGEFIRTAFASGLLEREKKTHRTIVTLASLVWHVTRHK